MANHPSAEKRARQRVKGQARNRTHVSRMRTHLKRARQAIAEKDPGKAADALRAAARAIDRAAQKGGVPRRRASRAISRLTLAVNRLRA